MTLPVCSMDSVNSETMARAFHLQPTTRGLTLSSNALATIASISRRRGTQTLPTLLKRSSENIPTFSMLLVSRCSVMAIFILNTSAERVGGECIAIDFEHALVAPPEYDYWRTVMPYFEASDAVDETVMQAFQDGYESVRPLPGGFEERRQRYRLLNWVAFLESLYLQQNVDPDKREEMGDWMRTRVYERLSEVRETVG